jgi:hypothetical protein
MVKLFYIIMLIISLPACEQPGNDKAGLHDTTAAKPQPLSPNQQENKDSTSGDETAVRIDTFSIDGQHFRIIRDTAYEGNVEQLVDGTWKQIINLGMLGMQQNYNYSEDANADGYNDLSFDQNRYISVVFLYDPGRKTITDSPTGGDCCYWSWELLDTSRKIFYDIHQTVMTGDDHSNLFAYKGLKAYPYYTIKYFVDKTKDEGFVDSVVLYKCHNGDEYDIIRVKSFDLPSKEIGAFDYSEYWKKNYKRLMAQY